jgi:phage-related protein
VARTSAPGEKPLFWIGSSREDLLFFPAETQDEIGNALGVAQFGGTFASAKPWKGGGPGVFEIVESYQGNAYRAVYTVRFQRAVYVLHAFQKKSPSRIRTAKRDVDLIHQRLQSARKHYEGRYGSNEG